MVYIFSLTPIRNIVISQGPFFSSGKSRNTDGDSQESTRWSSGRSRVLLKALVTDVQNYHHLNNHTIQTTDTPGSKPFTMIHILSYIATIFN